jgi:heat-inducible transcriptional repressor
VLTTNKSKGGDPVELNERKMKILHAIITDYLESAEPVGSRTISKNYNLELSPATIRNEMADLEELGFIFQPHTSSGRIPSDRGYRLYVDSLLKNQKAKKDYSATLDELISSAGRIESLLELISKMLARETQYATMVTSPQYKKSKIKNIQLIELEPKKLLAVVVTDGNVIKNYMIDIKDEIKQTVLNRLTFILNEYLYGLTIEDINLPVIQSLQQYAGDNAEIVRKVLEVIFKTIQSVDDMDIYTSGATNMLKLPEFKDVSKAMELIDTLEEKEDLKVLLNDAMGEDQDKITIKIGDEIKDEKMKECSLITSSYHIGGEKVGAIGIIGPKRMDYQKTINTLKYLLINMEKILNNN